MTHKRTKFGRLVRIACKLMPSIFAKGAGSRSRRERIINATTTTNHNGDVVDCTGCPLTGETSDIDHKCPKCHCVDGEDNSIENLQILHSWTNRAKSDMHPNLWEMLKQIMQANSQFLPIHYKTEELFFQAISKILDVIRETYSPYIGLFPSWYILKVVAREDRRDVALKRKAMQRRDVVFASQASPMLGKKRNISFMK